MAIKEGDFIRLSYTGRSNGILFDTTREADAKEAGVYEEGKKYEPVVLCVGKQQVLLGLDEALIGKDVGFSETIEIPPEKAFGAHESELMRSFEKKVFDEKPAVGMRVNIPNTGTGTVVNMIGNRVLVDFNHPLAGQTLSYSYTIDGVVESATEQVKGLVEIYSGVETEVSIAENNAEIMLPPGIYYTNRRWLSSKPFITTSIFDLITGIEEVRYVEKYPRPEKKADN